MGIANIGYIGCLLIAYRLRLYAPTLMESEHCKRGAAESATLLTKVNTCIHAHMRPEANK